MDDHSADLDMDGATEDEVWAGEQKIPLTGIPDQLWSEALVEFPPRTPEK